MLRRALFARDLDAIVRSRDRKGTLTRAMTISIWAVAILSYALFLGWYRNWRGALRDREVEALMARILAANPALEVRGDAGVLKDFLAGDDGREFFMLNLVKLSPDPVRDPATGALRPARDVLGDYTKRFVGALMRRAGHPAFVARKAGGYVDAWGHAPDPGWTIVGLMRYRSRRDLAELIADPRFAGAHASKIAAIPATVSFPMQPMTMLMAGPAPTVGLIIALLAALAEIAI